MIQINNIYDSNQKQGFKSMKNSPFNETSEYLMKENNGNEMKLIRNSIIDKYQNKESPSNSKVIPR